jgi:DNA mismatch repair protein MutS
MQQYRQLRGKIAADTLLLFRLGDFYELFFEAAKEASVLLNLRSRNAMPLRCAACRITQRKLTSLN